MPKFKQPALLETLAVQALVRVVRQRAEESISSGVYLNTSALHDYLYGELPDVLSQEVTAHMLAEVAGTLKTENCFNADVNDITKKVLLGIVYSRIRVLNLSNAPRYVVKTLCYNMQTFQKLHTFILKKYYMKADFAETLVAGLSSQKSLVHFQMPYECTDAIIQMLGSCCYATIQQIVVYRSRQVTDESFKILLKCRELKHLSIFDTSVTAEGFVQFLQHRKRDGTAEGFLGLEIGSWPGWYVSSTNMNEIALSSPMLKRLKISGLHANMEVLVSLTKLEALIVYGGLFDKHNFDGFLRARGCNITSLTLLCTQSIDLTCILNHCVYIRKLSVKGSCTCLMGVLETDSKACQCLETLKLFCEFSPSSIEGVLHACVNLTILHLCPREEHILEHITDTLILHVLSKNPLQKLTRFFAWCPELTMRAVDAIIEQCPLLEELTCVRCYKMSEAEVKILRQKIKNRNQDLKTAFNGMHIPL